MSRPGKQLGRLFHAEKVVFICVFAKIMLLLHLACGIYHVCLRK